MNVVMFVKLYVIDLQFIFKLCYGNYIGGEWVVLCSGQYFENMILVIGKVFIEVVCFNVEDIEVVFDVVYVVKCVWVEIFIIVCVNIFNRIVDCIEENLELFVYVEIWDNGKLICEIFNVDILLMVDYFCYFVGVVCVQEGSLLEIDKDIIVYYFYELLGVVGQIILWNFLMLMVVWKLVLVLVVGNCVVFKFVEQILVLILVLMEVIGDLLFKGVFNVVNGFGVEVGKLLVFNLCIVKIVFIGEIIIGWLIMQYVSQNLILVMLELGGKLFNIFFVDVMVEDDDFFDKVVEGFVLFVFNQGEVCICLLCVLIQELIYEEFMVCVFKCVVVIKQGNLLDFNMMVGVQVLFE